MLRKWGALVLLLLATPTLAFAQTGKIAGRVVDAETGESLPGATVQIEGSTRGAVTDIDGEYEIFEVPAGDYTLMASFTGYATERRENFQVTGDITNRADFSLSSAVTGLEEVIVQAERPLVNVTATNAVRRLGREELENLPTRNAQTYYAIQPGVTVRNGEVYIRGGRPDETEYLLEGISSRSLFGTDNVVPVIPEALEEVQVLAGGYSAEFGGANAGIITQTLRTGGERLEGLLQYETDQAAGVFGDHANNYSAITATIGGPLIWQRHRFFGAVDYNQTDNWDPVFWEGGDLGTPIDNTTLAEDDTAAAAILWEDGVLPGIQRPREQLRLNGSLSFDFSPLRIRVGYAQLTQNRRENDLPIYNYFTQERVFQRDDESRLVNGSATFFLSPKTYLEGRAGYFEYNLENYDPLFGSIEPNRGGQATMDLVEYFDRDAVCRELGGAVTDDVCAGNATAELYTKYWTNRYSAPSDYEFNGFRFRRPGDVAGFAIGGNDSYLRRQQANYNLGLNFTSQMDNHYVVAGGSYQKWTYRDYAFSGSGLASLIGTERITPDSIIAQVPFVASTIRNQGSGGIGYDEFMNEVDEGPGGARRPLQSALFINDRIEFNDIIINAGLRYDYFDMDLWAPADPAAPEYNSTTSTISGLTKTGGDGVLQPRLGLSFPISERTAFHLQYGKFAQMPDAFYLYRRLPYVALAISGQNFISNPFAWELDPIRSTQYEIGVGHQFADQASFDVTAFYRRTQGQLEIVRQTTTSGSSAKDYNVYTNGDFAITRGVEATLRTRRVGNFMGMLNYTLTDAKGTNSEPGGQVSALENGTAPPSLIQPLSFEQRHRGAAILDFSTGEGSGLTDDFTVNLLLTFNSGSRFTRSVGNIQGGPDQGAIIDGTDTRGRTPLEPLNASTTPWYFNTDLRLEKGFDFGMAKGSVFGYVTNLLNRRNVLNVYTRSGSAGSDLFLNTPELSDQIISGQGQEFVNYYELINLGNRQHYVDATANDIYAAPRQFRLGVRLEF